jgi:cystathionine gamma-synthase
MWRELQLAASASAGCARDNDHMSSLKGLQTRSIHAGRSVDPSTGAVTPPLHTSTTFERDPDGEFSRQYAYIRAATPNRSSLETCITALEGGDETISFGSGMAASLAVFQSLSPKDHVLLHRDVYYGVRELMEGFFAKWGLEHTLVDMRNIDEVRAASKPQTKMFWVETPTNPLIEVVDIASVAEAARAAGALLVCENTFATPVLQHPFELGADMVVHSLTKYLSGHSDAMGGSVTIKNKPELVTQIRDFQHTGGAILSPFDCWLILRGVQTLVPRVRLHCENARCVAEFLSTHKNVARVRYPGLADDSGHEIAKRQMKDFGGMLSFEVKGGREEAYAVAAALKVIVRATSLGGTHSLIEHRASVEGKTTRAPESLLRMSVGLEDASDIMQDLDQALATS